MIKHESAFDLFQRLNLKDENHQSQLIIDRLNRYHQLLFPNGFNHQGQLIELLDNNRTITKTFLHGFISDYIEYMKYRNELLLLPFQSEEILLNSPQANKDSVESDVPTLQSKLNYDQSITFIYFDTEYKECPFKSDFIQWYDCETSTELIGTLLRCEQSCFTTNPNHRFILIIDSSTQVPVNDYFNTTTPTHVMPIEENKLLTVQWHIILCRLIMKYKLACILVEHLDVDTPMFDTIIGKRRDERTIKRNSKNKEVHIPFSEFAFGRLMMSEHYMNEWNNQLEYRQVRGNDMMNFQCEPKQSSSSSAMLSPNDVKMNDTDENIL